jgi:hypothetical protein
MMSWDVLAGVIEWWADEDVRGVGRRRYNESKGRSMSDLVPKVITCTIRSAFVARRRPWRMTQIVLTANVDRAAVLAWADDATAVLKGDPPSQHIVAENESWGDLGLRSMLEPGPMELIVRRPWPSTLRIGGHLLEQAEMIMHEFTSLGSDYYEVTYDSERDILTSWSAFIDGDLAMRQEITQLVDVA